ncbi:hypothetical protein ID866_10691, partial [Astraeus odoratus]
IALCILISATAYSASVALRVQVYTSLVCRVHKPEYFPENFHLFQPTAHGIPSASGGLQTTHSSPNNSVGTLVNITVPHSPTADLEDDGDPERRCTLDPEVQATAAKLAASAWLLAGGEQCLVLATSALGSLSIDLTFIVTMNFVDYLPGGYWFLLVGFIIEGLIGFGTVATHAYIADTVEPASRSSWFSFGHGLAFVGHAVGPLIGGVIIRLTTSLLSAFFLSTILHIIYIVLVLFILPESLTKARAHSARLQYREKEEHIKIPIVLRILRRAMKLFTPLTMLLPQRVIGRDPMRLTKDWSLFFLSICYGLSSTLLSSWSVTFQYAIAMFGWTAEITSYYSSATGAAHALVLIVLLPCIIKLVMSPGIPCTWVSTVDELHERTLSHPSRLSVRTQSHSLAIDLFLARCALALNILGCWIMATATSGSAFVIGTIIGAAVVSFSPIVQSLALEIYSFVDKKGVGNAARGGQHDVGKLLGALSVLHAQGAHIIGPMAYGYLYSSTVATFPRAIIARDCLTGPPLSAVLKKAETRLRYRGTTDKMKKQL